ncbi:MAG: TlpA family protein disulfide reductase, partial [Candidatus Muiribacteriota bacterium]
MKKTITIIFLMFLILISTIKAEQLTIDEYDFTLPFYDREEDFSLSKQLQTKHVALVFYASWCGSCQRRMPTYSEIQQHLENTIIIAVNADEDFHAIETFFKGNNIKLESVIDKDYNVIKQYGISRVPH